jgi:RNA polymerase sigma-70 factor (ECF subfamily)
MSTLSGTQSGAGLPADVNAIAAAAAQQAELLRRAQHGDRSAYGHLVLACQDRLYNAVLRMVGDPDDARELTQETFMRGLQKIDSFRGEAQPYTWLFRIATNLVITEARKAQRQRTFSLDRPSPNGRAGDSDNQATGLADRLKNPAESPAEAADRREREKQVLAALGRIDAEYRAILVMRDVEDFDYQQMADVLALPLGTVKSRLFRARKALRDELQAYVNLK